MRVVSGVLYVWYAFGVSVACDVACLWCYYPLPPTLYALKPAQVQGGPGRHDDIHQSYSTKLSPLLPTPKPNQLPRLIILRL